MQVSAFSRTELPALFNEWMRRYTENPEQFKAEFQSVGEFLQQQAGGAVPSYGEHCVGYLEKLKAENEGAAPVSGKLPADARVPRNRKAR